MTDREKKSEDQQKQLIKDAMREGLDELGVTYTNGALKFTNALADSWTQVIDAFDNFMLGNLADDRPQIARTVLQARLSSAKRTQKHLTEKVRQLEQQITELRE
jgi:hypothetical protein